MRLIGHISDTENAERFGDYLTTLGIGHSIEESANGQAVWVEDDDDLERASGELAKFQANPADPIFNNVSKAAEAERKKAQREQERRAKNYYDVRTRWSGAATRARPVTIGLILISIIVGLITRLKPFDQHTPLWPQLSFASLRSMEEVKDPSAAWLNDMKSGEVWRVITPIFLHMSILHILFNMLWLADLGTMIEMRKGSLLFVALVICGGVIPCIVQNYWDGPIFGGMSGVVYALFGYCWMKGRFEPQEGIGVSQQTEIIMLAWLVICMTGWLGPIANAAHFAGLVVGVVFGQAPTSWRRARRKLIQGR
jgi:GlpG protein